NYTTQTKKTEQFADVIRKKIGLPVTFYDERLTSALNEVLGYMHMGSCTELEVEWAEMVKKLVPCAKDGLVRACACGGEAIEIAVRLARIYTGKDKVVIHENCYHGKWETINVGHSGPPYGQCNIKGIPESVRRLVKIIPYNHPDALKNALEEGDVACVILQGNAPYTKEYMEDVRELTAYYGVAFILDEVVSGFRYAPGGAQEYYGVIPDIAVLGKIVGGGAPIGAICGKEEIMKFHIFKEKDDYWNRFVRICVGGTWNAQPLSIRAGLEAMKIIDKERDEIYPRLYKICDELTKSLEDSSEEFSLKIKAKGVPPERPMVSICPEFNGNFKELAQYVYYLTLSNNGVHPFGRYRFIPCCKHSDEDLKRTREAIRQAFKNLKEGKIVQ
ncbi:TPA: aminotransferase class III-fold pyridoxal phosphate-dependent enzyme, partial [Candidatus Bathyarchaeota archaeon]|nr:aminotransferase class III-fold pyridoxal phosphate-dependent enzyme [Candidatus Bathyarchaeota archaeon]